MPPGAAARLRKQIALEVAGRGAGVLFASHDLQEVESLAPGSRLNLLLTDGEQLVATAWTHSLHVRRTADAYCTFTPPVIGWCSEQM